MKNPISTLTLLGINCGSGCWRSTVCKGGKALRDSQGKRVGSAQLKVSE